MTYTAEQQRERYYANLEERKAREYARKNRDKLNEQRRQLRARDGDRIREAEREYNRNKPRKRDRMKDARDRHGPWAAEDWAAMWDAQEGRCYLCGEEMLPEEEKIDVDHDHSCCRQGKSCRNCRRGLAHHHCNVVIGFAGDSPDRLRRIADALEAAQLTLKQRRIAAGIGEQLTLSVLY
jgi:hypothetical protein